jgi:ankyrin repeat protein
VDVCDSTGQPLLLRAVMLQDKGAVGQLPAVVDMLLSSAGPADGAPSACVNARCRMGKTMLMWAVEADNVALVRVLLAHGADVNAADHRGRTALMLPSYRPHLTRLLLHARADAAAVDSQGWGALAHALTGRAAGMDGKLLRTLRLLLRAGADPTLVDARGRTVVMLAAGTRMMQDTVTRVLLEALGAEGWRN